MIYALTLKKTRKPILLTDYEDYLTWLQDRGYKVTEVNYEDTKGLHVHFILSAPAELIYGQLKRDPYGWSIRFVPIYNRTGWMKYITKDTNRDVYNLYMKKELEAYDPRSRGVEPGDGFPEPPGDEQDSGSEELANSIKLKWPNFDIRKFGKK